MIERYRITTVPGGYLVEGYFNVTWKRNWFQVLFRFPKGLYGWHTLDLTGHKYYTDGYAVFGPALFNSEQKAKWFIDWQQNLGKTIDYNPVRS
jgi:hypothetical protein